MKRLPPGYLEIFLNQGETFFGDESTRIRTLLGSCVAVTMWHPRLRRGGMCHFLLPERAVVVAPRGVAATPAEALDARFGREALELLFREARGHGTDPADYRYKIFGGGNMFGGRSAALPVDVGQRNARFAVDWIEALGYAIDARHLGGCRPRNVIFAVWSGDVWLRQVDMRKSKETVDE